MARIVDEYLIEGIEIIFRYGLALIQMYKKQLKKQSHQAGAAWWAEVRSQVHTQHFDFRQLQSKAHSRFKGFAFTSTALSQALAEATELVAQQEKSSHRMLLTPDIASLPGHADDDETKAETITMIPNAAESTNIDDDAGLIPVPFAQVLQSHSSLIRNLKEATRLLNWCPESVRYNVKIA